MLQDEIELRRLRTENRLLRQRIDLLENESSELADKLIQVDEILIIIAMIMMMEMMAMMMRMMAMMAMMAIIVRMIMMISMMMRMTMNMIRRLLLSPSNFG